MTNPAELILLPGLGADARQFEPQRVEFPNLVVPPWIAPLRGEPLPAYAERMAETMPRGRPIVLGGSSFGGMVACEMAQYVKPAMVVLIGSCRGPSGVRPLLRSLRPIVPLLPAVSISVGKLLAPPAVRMFSLLDSAQRKLRAKMLRDADPRFVRWGAQALLDWQPGPLPSGIPIRHIHGARDRVLPAARAEVDVLVPGAGHLVNMTHAEQVNRYLREVICAAI